MGEYVLIGARISAGLMAGLYFAFAVAVMPALHRLGDAAFVETMNRINVSIVNPIFLLIFFAAPVLAVVAAVLVRSPVVYTAAALGVGTLLITLVANVPLNNKLAAGASRADFESLWVLFNDLRTITSIGSLVLLLLSPSTVH
ncbi:MAG: anthrone oxygenase family protein [Ornithinimicrobium sp.]